MKEIFNLTKFRKSKLYKSVAGQMLVIFALTWIIFAGGMFTVYNVGTLVGEKMRLQTAADSAAYTGAVWEARTLNYFAYVNRSIVAELSFICYLCALTSCLDAWKTVCEYLKNIPFPPITAVFSALYGILEGIYQVLNMVVDLPWELLPQAMGGLQTAMEVFLEAEQVDAMKKVAEEMDEDISINESSAPDMGGALLVNVENHLGIRKTGTGDGLLKVVEDTIGRYTKGKFNGGFPIYNRSTEIDTGFGGLSPIKLVLGMIGDYDLTKSQIKTTDGPGLRIYTWGIDPCSDEPGWICWVSLSWPAFEKTKNLDMDSIRYYVFDQDKNQSAGVYAITKKKADSLSDLVYQNIGGLLGADKVDLITMAKARACYEDPDFASNRHSVLSGDLEPNLFNPFWKAELVSLKAKDEEDASFAQSEGLILSVMQGAELLNKH